MMTLMLDIIVVVPRSQKSNGHHEFIITAANAQTHEVEVKLGASNKSKNSLQEHFAARLVAALLFFSAVLRVLLQHCYSCL